MAAPRYPIAGHANARTSREPHEEMAQGVGSGKLSGDLGTSEMRAPGDGPRGPWLCALVPGLGLLGTGDVVLADRRGILRVLRLLAGVHRSRLAVLVERGARTGRGLP